MPTKQNKGFTLLEILLVIAAIGILAAIVLVAINPNRQIAQARNIVRQADINTIQKAVEQYLIEKGSYPNGITNTYREICNTGSNSITQGIVNSGCIDLRELVPDYIASIPVNPSTSTHSGYYAWINDSNNKVAILAGKGENGKVIGVNHLKENIVTDGLVLHLDAGHSASYPGTGNTWFDLSGNNNNGTLVNGVGYNSANGGSLVFDGVNDYVTVPAGFANFSSGLTIIGIVNFGNASFWERIIDFGNGSANNNILLARNATSNTLTFEIYNGGVRFGQCSVTNGILNNTIAQYAVTINGTNCVMYRNEQILATFSYPYLPVNVTRNNSYIGRSNWPDAYFENAMYTIQLYNRALTEAEIQQNYNALKGRFGL